MPRYKLTIEYEGNRFSGWQRQLGVISVQGAIESAIKLLFQEDVCVEGAGRTDAGVHALGQVAHVDLSRAMPDHRICDGLNSHLRHQGASILKVEEVPPDFHARFSATERVYEYHICNRRSPLTLKANHAWHVIPSLDVEKMQAAANHLLGHHDFTSFRTAHCQAPSPVKTLQQFNLNYTRSRDDVSIIARIVSRSFLHNQVRIMMGTIKLVGEGRLKVEDIPHILTARDRRKSGPTAPPCGLYLVNITY